MLSIYHEYFSSDLPFSNDDKKKFCAPDRNICYDSRLLIL